MEESVQVNWRGFCSWLPSNHWDQMFSVAIFQWKAGGNGFKVILHVYEAANCTVARKMIHWKHIIRELTCLILYSCCGNRLLASMLSLKRIAFKRMFASHVSKRLPSLSIKTISEIFTAAVILLMLWWRLARLYHSLYQLFDLIRWYPG